jgi:hypothetical protein
MSSEKSVAVSKATRPWRQKPGSQHTLADYVEQTKINSIQSNDYCFGISCFQISNVQFIVFHLQLVGFRNKNKSKVSTEVLFPVSLCFPPLEVGQYATLGSGAACHPWKLGSVPNRYKPSKVGYSSSTGGAIRS